jgi:hypothetical protein
MKFLAGQLGRVVLAYKPQVPSCGLEVSHIPKIMGAYDELAPLAKECVLTRQSALIEHNFMLSEIVRGESVRQARQFRFGEPGQTFSRLSRFKSVSRLFSPFFNILIPLEKSSAYYKSHPDHNESVTSGKKMVSQKVPAIAAPIFR